MKEVASLRYGVTFKKDFSKSNIFKASVKGFLGLELEIDQVETEKSFSPIVSGVGSRFDFCLTRFLMKFGCNPVILRYHLKQSCSPCRRPPPVMKMGSYFHGKRAAFPTNRCPVQSS